MSSTMTETQTEHVAGVLPQAAAAAPVDLAAYDDEQVRLMEERCILVTPADEAYGDDSKKTCHLMENINKGLLHRAFSVFLFNPTDGRLLLQKRADEKITFPSMWTNTCCSHPLAIKKELIELDQEGVRNAAIRKLPHELGIKLGPGEGDRAGGDLEKDDFTYLGRIHYLAPSDGIWGEHEIDYILFTTVDVTTEMNVNEVSDAKYVSKAELQTMFKEETNSFTPWFRLIARDLLFPWWDEMMAKCAESGSRRVDAKVLRGKVEGNGPVLKLV